VGQAVAVALLLAAVVTTACTRALVTPEPGKPQTGMASWYGPGFHGRTTSNGERYDQHEMTAAHRTLPFDTKLLVTNLANGKSVQVRINDRGPFVDDRVIDLSRSAATAIGMIGPGTAPVRLRVVARPPGGHTHVVHCVQVGAFRHPEKAEALRTQLAARYGDVYVTSVPDRNDPLYRVRVGPFLERRYAESRAVDLTQFGYPAVVTEEPHP
jgi:rare lipoprotein A